MNNKQLGSYGESIAGLYLQKQGFKIVETNFFSRYGEIDIIAEKDGMLNFVEVKTRTSDCCGQGVEAVTALKLQRMLKTLNFYIYQNNLNEKGFFISILGVTIKKDGKIKIDYEENITV